MQINDNSVKSKSYLMPLQGIFQLNNRYYIIVRFYRDPLELLIIAITYHIAIIDPYHNK